MVGSRSLTLVLTAAIALSGLSACDTAPPEPARVRLNLSFPDRDTAIETKSLVLLSRVVRDGDRPCIQSVFDIDGALSDAFTTVVSYPRDNDQFNFPAAKDNVDVYVYAYGAAFDRTCSPGSSGECGGGACADLGIGRSACTAASGGALDPLAVGCANTSVGVDGVNEVSVMLFRPAVP